MNPIGRQTYEGLMPFLYMAMANSNKSLEWCNILYDRGSHSRYNGWRAAIYVHLGDIETAKTYLQKLVKMKFDAYTYAKLGTHISSPILLV